MIGFHQTRNAFFISVCLWAFVFSQQFARAETRLFVPQFRTGPDTDTQLLVINTGERDATLDLWAFRQSGDLIGQYQLPVAAQSTKSVTLGDIFQLKTESVTGWIGAVSSSDGLQLSYTLDGGRSGSHEAKEWGSRENRLIISDPATEVVHFANPNPFATSMNLSGIDDEGRTLSPETMTLAPFAQLEVAASKVLGGRARQLKVAGNADIISDLNVQSSEQPPVRPSVSVAARGRDLALVLNSTAPLGAYQVTVRFDPAIFRFQAADIQGGTTAGFDSPPLVVNVDNVGGNLTIGSFQIGARPVGRIDVAHIHTSAGLLPSPALFGLTLETVTDVAGKTIAGQAVSLGLFVIQK
jgi:hypothetical protein